MWLMTNKRTTDNGFDGFCALFFVKIPRFFAQRSHFFAQRSRFFHQRIRQNRDFFYSKQRRWYDGNDFNACGRPIFDTNPTKKLTTRH